MDIGNRYIILKFSNEPNYEMVLFGGLWLITNHYLLDKKYSPFFDPETSVVSKMPVWVRVS